MVNKEVFRGFRRIHLGNRRNVTITTLAFTRTEGGPPQQATKPSRNLPAIYPAQMDLAKMGRGKVSSGSAVAAMVANFRLFGVILGRRVEEGREALDDFTQDDVVFEKLFVDIGEAL